MPKGSSLPPVSEGGPDHKLSHAQRAEHLRCLLPLLVPRAGAWLSSALSQPRTPQALNAYPSRPASGTAFPHLGTPPSSLTPLRPVYRRPLCLSDSCPSCDSLSACLLRLPALPWAVSFPRSVCLSHPRLVPSLQPFLPLSVGHPISASMPPSFPPSVPPSAHLFSASPHRALSASLYR